MGDESKPCPMAFVIPGKNVKLLKENVHRVKRLFNVDVLFSIAFKKGDETMQWIRLLNEGSTVEEMINAKQYIMSMTSPEMSIGFRNFSPHQTQVDEIEARSGAVLKQDKNEVVIQGSQTSVLSAKTLVEECSQKNVSRAHCLVHEDKLRVQARATQPNIADKGADWQGRNTNKNTFYTEGGDGMKVEGSKKKSEKGTEVQKRGKKKKNENINQDEDENPRETKRHKKSTNSLKDLKPETNPNSSLKLNKNQKGTIARLYLLDPCAKFELVGREGTRTARVKVMSVTINNQRFIGNGRTNKLAKKAAALNAINGISGIPSVPSDLNTPILTKDRDEKGRDLREKGLERENITVKEGERVKEVKEKNIKKKNEKEKQVEVKEVENKKEKRSKVMEKKGGSSEEDKMQKVQKKKKKRKNELEERKECGDEEETEVEGRREKKKKKVDIKEGSGPSEDIEEVSEKRSKKKKRVGDQESGEEEEKIKEVEDGKKKNKKEIKKREKTVWEEEMEDVEEGRKKKKKKDKDGPAEISGQIEKDVESGLDKEVEWGQEGGVGEFDGEDEIPEDLAEIKIWDGEGLESDEGGDLLTEGELKKPTKYLRKLIPDVQFLMADRSDQLDTHSYTISVKVNDVTYTGTGSTRRKAKKAAAKKALEGIQIAKLKSNQAGNQTVAPDSTLTTQPASNEDTSASLSKPNKKPALKYVVIDGNNVAMTHGKGSSFSIKGIKICIDYFLARGHKVTAFVSPRVKLDPNSRTELTQLVSDGHAKITPARRLLSGKIISSYDDRFILNLADVQGGVVVSNDQFRDLVAVKPSYKEIIENRLLPFMFVGNVFMPPDDPLGRDGPTLDEFLGGERKEPPPNSERVSSAMTNERPPAPSSFYKHRPPPYNNHRHPVSTRFGPPTPGYRYRPPPPYQQHRLPPPYQQRPPPPPPPLLPHVSEPPYPMEMSPNLFQNAHQMPHYSPHFSPQERFGVPASPHFQPGPDQSLNASSSNLTMFEKFQHLKKLGLSENYDEETIEKALKHCDMTKDVEPKDFLDFLKFVKSQNSLS